jgi:predicted unusual protein kinase regulating ubiquinone biosynthesis (AarF/ABC1/UbiB family)
VPLKLIDARPIFFATPLNRISRLDQDNEANRLSARASRYARLGVNAGAFAARVGVNRLRGGGRETDAKALASALGSMKGPLMKVAQMLTTIPDAVPSDFAAELTKLQSQAPPMGASFVRRRMQAELGPNWRERFAEFDLKPAAAASLGQVHRAVSLGGERLACKLQYPDMASAVETDLSNLDLLFSLHRRASAAIDTREMAREIRERVREELDYQREAKIARLYRVMLADRPFVRVPRIDENLSTRRLLSMEWLDGEPLTAFETASREARDAIAVGLFDAWWRPFLRYGVIHGDPHLGNYTVAAAGEGAEPRIEGVNLFDYGCVRIFPPRFVHGVVELYRALEANDRARIAHAFEMWGFTRLTPGVTEAMTMWARFMCGPILDDRVRTAADGVKPSEYGRREIGQVMRALRAEGGGLPVPREFVFLERATIGLGSAFLRLGARLNFHRMYEDAIARRQTGALEAVGLGAVGAPAERRAPRVGL